MSSGYRQTEHRIPHLHKALFVGRHIMNTPIKIDSLNAYRDIYKGRKLVDRETLRLIKMLRQEGYDVIVLPEDDVDFEYLFQKGETSILSDPAFQLLISLPIGIGVGLLTNWIQKKLDSANGKKSNNILIVNNSTKIVTNIHDTIISNSQLIDIKRKKKKYYKEMAKCLHTQSPLPGLPYPILLDHKPIIIGWCRLHETNIGLEVEKGIITDKNVYRKIQKGKYKGGSVTGIATKSTCSICNSNFTKCNHIAGQFYEDSECHNMIVEADLIEVSIVKEPINTQTLVKLL